MTDPEMNVRAPKKMFRPVVVLAGVTLCAVGLAGCGSFDPAMDAASPLAPRVQALVEANRTYPRWENFPATTPAPEPAQLAAQVNTLRATGGALAGEVSRIEWTLGDPEAFQRDVTARLDAAQMSPASAQTNSDIEAYAARLRERAKAPPPVDRRQ